MLGLLGLHLAWTAAMAGLPTRKQPAHLWAELPQAVETVRQLHQMLPHDDGGEPTSEAETAASFEAFLRARGGRIEPMWTNHSHVERTANLQRHASRRSERRRAQAWITGATPWADDSMAEKESSLASVLEPPDLTCDDPLATNTGQPTPCTYDCADLRNEYFPEPHDNYHWFNRALPSDPYVGTTSITR